ncbi:MAG: NADH-quinone oxidoreductase subunit M [Deltaproteobacteria bacterium]|nr:NADH-quinone oxidoreductase subunit M [Deltaproteobacteria bacterium]
MSALAQIPILPLLLATPLACTLLTLVVPERLIKPLNATLSALALGLALALALGFDATTGGYQFAFVRPWIPAFRIQLDLAADGIAVLMSLLNAVVYFTGTLTMWSLNHRTREYFAFISLLVFGVFGVFLSRDLFAFFFFYEVAVLPMYPLIAVWGSTRKAYAAMKLTLYLMAGSALLFPSLIALYVLGGGDTWSIPELARRGFDPSVQVFLYPFLYVGFGILAGMWPLHGWSPTGHVAAPTSVSMLHAGVLMKLGAFGILRVAIGILPHGAEVWAPVAASLATAGIIYGAFVAWRQTDFKYVIGFSSVSHMGIVLLGLATLSADGTRGAVFQMFAHGVMTALFFSVVGFIYDQTHDRDIDHYGGLATQVPVAGTLFILAALCGMGVPGFASFVAEFLVFVAALQAWPVLGIIAIAGLVITAAYLLRVLGKALFGPPNPERAGLLDLRPVQALPRVILAGLLLLFGFVPQLALDLISHIGAVVK